MLEFFAENGAMILENTGISIYMVLVSTLMAYLFGVPIGIILVVTAKDGIHPMPLFNQFLGVVVNLLRSIPFLILLFMIDPFTKFITGSSFGANATIVPLVVSAAPFIARLIESSCVKWILVLLKLRNLWGPATGRLSPRSCCLNPKPSLLVGTAIAATTILGYSAMAGVVGGGGLGDVAIRYGFYRYQKLLMYVCVLILVIITQIIQEAGLRIANRTDKRLH